MTHKLRTFYILIATQALSIIGSSMTGFAIGVWIFTETGNTTPLLYVSLFTFLPRGLFGSFAGVFADRFNRKRLIILSDAGQAIPTLLLALAFATGQFQIWQLYTAALIQGCFGMIQGPSLSASITMLVPDSHRDRANALTQVVGPVAGIVAPILGGLLYTVIGVTGVLAVDFVTFIIAVLVISSIHIPQPKQSTESQKAKGSLLREMRGGLAFLMTRRGLLILSCYFMFLNFMTEGVWRLMTPYILTRVNYNENILGVILATSSAGLVTGGLIPIVWRGTKTRIHTVFPALAAGAIGLMLFALAKTPLLLAVIVFAMMLPYKLCNALLSSVQQAKIPPDMQGRVFGLLGQISLFAIPLSMLITGPLVDKVLEPAVQQPGWARLAPYFGSEAGAGMALYIFTCGLIVCIMTLLVYALPIVRYIERDLPNYEAVEEGVPASEAVTQAA